MKKIEIQTIIKVLQNTIKEIKSIKEPFAQIELGVLLENIKNDLKEETGKQDDK